MQPPHQAAPDREDILVLLRRRFPDAVVDPTAIRLEGPISTARYSRIFRAHVAGLSSPLVVKCLLDPLTGGPDRTWARVQFDVLDRVQRATTNPDQAYRVPVPYLLAEPEGIVVAEWVDGRPMTELFLSRHLTVDQGRELVRRAAAWLRHFFSLRPLSPEPLDVHGMLEEIDAMERAQPSSHRSVRAASVELRKHAEAAGDCPMERSWLHGDFKSDNLLVDGASTVGIDMYARYENAVAHDLASFVNHWELTLCDPRAWRWRPHREEIAGEFLDAFDPTYRRERRLPYAWIALFGMLGLWDEFRRRRTRTLRHVYLEACFGHLVRRMTRELAKAAGSRVR
jgi:hypothetical protein